MIALASQRPPLNFHGRLLAIHLGEVLETESDVENKICIFSFLLNGSVEVTDHDKTTQKQNSLTLERKEKIKCSRRNLLTLLWRPGSVSSIR